MKNRGGIDRINTLINTLQQIQISSTAALSELCEIKHELTLHDNKRTKQHKTSLKGKAAQERKKKVLTPIAGTRARRHHLNTLIAEDATLTQGTQFRF